MSIQYGLVTGGGLNLREQASASLVKTELAAANLLVRPHVFDYN